MTVAPEFAVLLLVLLVSGVLAELAWSRRSERSVYNLKESLNNLVMLVVGQALKPLSLAWTLVVLSAIEPFQMLRLPETPWVFALTFVATDLAFYVYHRTSHEVPFLWTMHHTHHSSPWMNLTTALRLNWVAKFVGPVFYAPLVLFGMPIQHIAVAMTIGLLYQLWLHTEAIPRLGGFEGKLLNTPSAHRVHHGSNDTYIDRNYAGVFVVWDRMFGTYQPEEEPVRYGVTTGFQGHNPLVAQFAPMWSYLRGQWRTERERCADELADGGVHAEVPDVHEAVPSEDGDAAQVG